jgi:uncharacterized protein YbaP (TraB family)
VLAAAGVLAGSLMLGCLPSAADAAASPVPAQEPPPAQLMDDVVVTGERTGPGMWHVHRGDAHLWILGSLSPLPKGITWRSKQVEQILGSTNRVLVPKPLEIGIVHILWLLITERKALMVGGGRRLKDVMPPDLYARFSQLRAKYTSDSDKWERYRPIIATAFLQQDAFRQAGLSARLDLGAAVRMLAKKHDVPVEEVKTLQPATERICVAASLVTIESGLPSLIDRAQAWATGNLERIRALHQPPEVDACLAALDAGAATGDLIARIKRTWFNLMDRYLQSGGVTLAVVNMDILLGRDGLLDELRAKGYEVDAP